MSSVSFSDNIEIHSIEKIDYNQENQDTSNISDTSADVSPKKDEKKYITHTKFCTFGLNKCRRGERCIYAHTFKQLNPIICKWDLECLRKEKCYYKHSNETKVQYVKRAFPDDLKRLNIVLYNNLDSSIVSLQKRIDKNEENNDNNDTEENNEPFDEEGYKRCLEDFRRKYYDPAFEHYSWADINEFVDSDEDW